MKIYLSVKQCVARLNGAVSNKLIYRLAAQGRLRVNRNLGKLLIEEDSLVELLEGEPRPPPAPEEPPPAPKRRVNRKNPGVELDLW